MKWLLDSLMEASRGTCRTPPGPLSFFKDVVCEDASICKLPDAMAAAWPGPRTTSSPAAAKVHARIRATTGELLKVKKLFYRVADMFKRENEHREETKDRLDCLRYMVQLWMPHFEQYCNNESMKVC